MGDAHLFCDVVAGREAASIVFEVEKTVTFLDVREFNAGHTLVAPYSHM